MVGGHLDRSDCRNRYSVARAVIMPNRVEVPFKSENDVADLPVVPELASADEYAVVVSIAEVQAQEGVGYVTLGPGSPNVAAKIEAGPGEHWGHVGRRHI